MPKRLAALTLVVALVAAACGSGTSDVGLASLEDTATSDGDLPTLVDSDGSSGSDGVADAAAGMTSEEAMLALAECLRDQGLDVQDPEMSDDGFVRMRDMFGSVEEGARVDREEMRAAMESCSVYTEAIRTEFGQVDRTEMEDQIFEYAECMRDNGYEMPDPDFSTEPGQGQGQGGGPFSGIDQSDPDFQAANAVCQDLFGGVRPGGLEGGPGGGDGTRPGGGDGPPPGGA